MAIPSLLAALLLAGCFNVKNDAAGPLWRVEPLLRVGNGVDQASVAESYYRLGRYYAGQSRLRQAEAAYLRAIAVDPAHAEAHNALGVLFAGQGRLAEAIASLQHAAALAPERSHIFSNLGYAQLLAGHAAAAQTQLTRALQLDPANQRARSNLQLARQKGTESLPTRAAGAELVQTTLSPLVLPEAQPIAPNARLVSGKISRAGSEQVAAAPPPPAPVPAEVPDVMPQQVVPPLSPLAVVQPVAEVQPPVVSDQQQGVVAPSPAATLAGEAPEEPLLKLVRQLTHAGSAVPGSGLRELPAGASGAAKTETSKKLLLLDKLRFEIANGMGERGVARKVNRMLMQGGLPSAYLTDAPPFTQEQTAVTYASERYALQAQELARRLGAQAQEEKRLWHEHSVGLRIVLGKDIQPVLAAAERGREQIASAGR